MHAAFFERQSALWLTECGRVCSARAYRRTHTSEQLSRPCVHTGRLTTIPFGTDMMKTVARFACSGWEEEEEVVPLWSWWKARGYKWGCAVSHPTVFFYQRYSSSRWWKNAHEGHTKQNALNRQNGLISRSYLWFFSNRKARMLDAESDTIWTNSIAFGVCAARDRQKIAAHLAAGLKKKLKNWWGLRFRHLWRVSPWKIWERITSDKLILKSQTNFGYFTTADLLLPTAAYEIPAWGKNKLHMGAVCYSKKAMFCLSRRTDMTQIYFFYFFCLAD